MKHGLVVAAALAIASTPFQAFSARAFDACLGAKVTACLDGVKPYISALDDQLARQSIDRFLAGDIAGKRKARDEITVLYHSKFAGPYDSAQTLTLNYTTSLATTGVEISLLHQVQTAQSEEDYRETQMYETVLFALGSREGCRELATPHDFYFFFHTKVRPRLKTRAIERAVGEYKPPSEFFADTGWIGICGRQMNYIASSATWGALQEDMQRKYVSSRTSLAFR